ncbi:hypothetical protein Cylst_0347 [Cylindrospermum stagnale PCC 7417]|uniref:NAD dependent epimerase/dehydratase family protein n=1 Tax=Cylindrospermum stagnale PCC 7417 TaxID=56107 RepID=K9WSF4_9NOST|nr:hypothetical protein Cylst_0347 [Cylindrospermum stagnale PCC 7417]
MSKLPKVIVFGASDFIGEHFIKYLADNNFDIYAAVTTKPEYIRILLTALK